MGQGGIHGQSVPGEQGSGRGKGRPVLGRAIPPKGRGETALPDGPAIQGRGNPLEVLALNCPVRENSNYSHREGWNYSQNGDGWRPYLVLGRREISCQGHAIKAHLKFFQVCRIGIAVWPLSSPLSCHSVLKVNKSGRPGERGFDASHNLLRRFKIIVQAEACGQNGQRCAILNCCFWAT